MNVLVFCEHNPSMDSPEGKAAYPEGLGECLAQLLREAGHTATLLPMDEQGVHGFTDELLNSATSPSGGGTGTTTPCRVKSSTKSSTACIAAWACSFCTPRISRAPFSA